MAARRRLTRAPLHEHQREEPLAFRPVALFFRGEATCAPRAATYFFEALGAFAALGSAALAALEALL